MLLGIAARKYVTSLCRLTDVEQNDAQHARFPVEDSEKLASRYSDREIPQGLGLIVKFSRVSPTLEASRTKRDEHNIHVTTL